MIRYLIDTNVVSELRKPQPHGAAVAWLHSLELGQAFFSVVTFGEIQRGVKANEIELGLEQMKRVVLNRENSLFVGNPRGGRTAAILASLTSSCRRHEMDPQLYFMQLLMNFHSWPANDIHAWLPDRWKQAHADRCEALEIPPLDP